VDFRISKWISGFQSGFQSGFLDLKVDFYIIFKVDLDFWVGPGAKATCIWRIHQQIMHA